MRAVPRLCGLYPGFSLTTEEQARRNLSQGSRRVPDGTIKTEYTEQNIHNNKNTYILTYLLTYYMVQRPWETNWFAASLEIPRISRSPKVHYRTHKRPPSVSILCQPNPVHIPTSHLLEIRHNIIYPSTSTSPQWSLSILFPHQDPIHPLSSPIRATCPAHLILLDFITRTILGEEYK